MKHKQDVISKANDLIETHMKNGLSKEDAEKAALVTIIDGISLLRYSGYMSLSLYQRTYNYFVEILMPTPIENRINFIIFLIIAIYKIKIEHSINHIKLSI